jgi:hypothetical protein
MGVSWTEKERTEVERGIAEHGIDSKRCAVLARIIYAVAKPKDPLAHGVHIHPAPGARWLVPKVSMVPYWGSHTYVETRDHAVDAITGSKGYLAAAFLNDHWEFSATIRKTEVDPATIDRGLQHVDEEL